MDTLYDQLLGLQHIPNAYDEWTAYRAALTDFIVTHTKKGTSALIIGAGECNDYDLNRMIEHFSEITLLDHNEIAICEGLKHQSVEPVNIRVVKADLLGIPEDDYRTMCDVLLHEMQRQYRYGKINPDVIVQLFLSQMAAIFQNRHPDQITQRDSMADYVICCGVHSQLINIFPQMAGVYHRYLKIDIKHIYEVVHSMNTVIAREFNTRLLRMAKVGVILGLEDSRVGMDGGIEGAAQALECIQSGNAEITNETALIWPFEQSQGKIYIMKVMLLSK